MKKVVCVMILVLTLTVTLISIANKFFAEDLQTVVKKEFKKDVKVKKTFEKYTSLPLIDTSAATTASTKQTSTDSLDSMYQEYSNAFRNGQYNESFSSFLGLAKKGHVPSMVDIARHYHFGYGTKTDYSEALFWYEKAFSLGAIGAANHIGRMYLNGEGLEKNPDMALDWYKKAAYAGNAIAQLNVASALESKGNREESLIWIIVAYKTSNNSLTRKRFSDKIDILDIKEKQSLEDQAHLVLDEIKYGHLI